MGFGWKQRLGIARWAALKALIHGALGIACGYGLARALASGGRGPAWLVNLATVTTVISIVGIMEVIHVHRGQPAWKTALDLGTWFLAVLTGVLL